MPNDRLSLGVIDHRRIFRLCVVRVGYGPLTILLLLICSQTMCVRLLVLCSVVSGCLDLAVPLLDLLRCGLRLLRRGVAHSPGPITSMALLPGACGLHDLLILFVDGPCDLLL